MFQYVLMVCSFLLINKNQFVDPFIFLNLDPFVGMNFGVV